MATKSKGNSAKLKPCPLCGEKEARIIEYYVERVGKTYFYAACTNDKCRMSSTPEVKHRFFTTESALETWNNYPRNNTNEL